MTGCIFCRIVQGEIPAELVYEDEYVIVFSDINPKARVHLLIVPREHVAGLDVMTQAHDAMIAHAMRLLPVLAKQQGLESGFRTIINTGKGGGQEVFHLHIHLLGGDGLPGF